MRKGWGQSAHGTNFLFEKWRWLAETLIEGSDTLLEGNGGWAQGQLRKNEDYLR